MLIDALTFTLRKTAALEPFWGKLDSGGDATLAVASSARPFLVAARFAHRPQPTLVVIAGEEAADNFARNLASYVGDEKVLRFFERSDYPFEAKPSKPREVSCRMQALHALASGQPKLVVSSARALLRLLPPPEGECFMPLRFRPGLELAKMGNAGVTTFESLKTALDQRGYANTGELEGPGSFCVRGGALDLFPGNLVYPIRLDFFGDELDEIRRILPSTGQTISRLDTVEIFPIKEFSLTKKGAQHAREVLAKPAKSNQKMRELFEKLEGGLRFDGADALLPLLYKRTATLGEYLGPEVLTVLLEPRSLVDDASYAFDDIASRSKGSSIDTEGLYSPVAKLDFGANQRASYVSIMQVGGAVDDELPVKRAEVAGYDEKLYGKLRDLVDADYTVVFSVPGYKARQDMRLELVDRSIPIVEVLDVAAGESKEQEAFGQGLAREGEQGRGTPSSAKRLKRGLVNIVDVEIPLGMIIPKAKLALISIADTQSPSRTRKRKHIDITEITFPYRPGDYVVHAAHGIAFFKELVCQELDGIARDYLLLEYAQNDKLYVPVEQLDRVTRYVGPDGTSPRLTRLNTADWSRALKKAVKATKQLAFDLVDVYARRSSTLGYR
ncbi:MAG: transcription-repair coupling factor, partial [Eggerthellaceae bacterium]|nr:transcription-repair coupling factor [Eggerthellaceae bacterium]